MACLRLLADGAQQVAEMLGQTLDGRGVEQFAGVVEGQAQATVAVFFAVQLQVELGFAAVPRQLFGEQPRQAFQGAEVALLVVEHDLEQALFAGLREGFEQLLERQVLMRLRTQRGLAGLRQQFNERQARVQLGAQHLGVDEEADQALGFQARTVGIRHADADVALAAVAMQQALERREQQHERRGFVGLGGLANRIAEGRVQAHGVARGAVQLLRRARVVGGQAQGRMLIAQLRFPVRQLPLALALRQPLALPAAVVGVLGRQWRERRRCPWVAAAYRRENSSIRHIQRPAVGDDVVQRHQQLVIFIVEAHQRHPQQRAFLQIELGARFVLADLLRAGFTLGDRQIADVDQLQVEFGGRIDLLQGHDRHARRSACAGIRGARSTAGNWRARRLRPARRAGARRRECCRRCSAGRVAR